MNANVPRKCKENKINKQFARFGGALVYLKHVHYIVSHSTIMVCQNLPPLALKIQMRASVAIKRKW